MAPAKCTAASFFADARVTTVLASARHSASIPRMQRPRQRVGTAPTSMDSWGH